jgi:hypothetical protein|tara:strand:- start:5135 stop:5716 length:582 start_codon:yes stop_codon:yes gene_type:complete
LSLLRYLLISFLLITCTSTSTYQYSVESNNLSENIDLRLNFNIHEDNSNNHKIEIQAFPKELNLIDSYKIVFDMKFRDDYESDFNGVCIGPTWDGYGPGEFTVVLDENSSFKASINGKLSQESDDRCNNYYFYARFLDINLKNGISYLVGVATDYGGLYPDAPEVWKLDTNNEIELIFTSNIERYSINFELSK